MASQTRKRAAPRKRSLATDDDGSRRGPDHHEVAARAYELFQQRGGAHGYDTQDWLLAEQQLSR